MRTITFYLAFILFLFCDSIYAQEMRQGTTTTISTFCKEYTDVDKENAIVTFNPTTHVLTLTTDIFEAIDGRFPIDTTSFFNGRDGMPLTLTSKIDIPDLEFKSGKNNGERYTFNTTVQCNDHERMIQVTYIFIYAPIVTQNATAFNFRLGFVVNLNPADFGLNLPKECTEITLVVQDAWLNRIH